MFEDLHKGGQPWPPISQIIMKITVVGIILLQCLLLSCKNKENSDEIQNINFLEKAIGENGINEIVEKIKIVEFDDNIDSYFSNPKKVIVSDERVYVLDKFNGRSIIKVFTKDCDFINMLDFFGKGPGEFINISDFAIKHNGEIIINDIMQSKLIYYNRDFKYLRSVKSDYYYEQIALLSDSLMAIVNNDNVAIGYKLLLIDDDSKILHKGVKVNELYDFMIGTPFQLNNDGLRIHYLPYYSDTIYEVTSQGVSLKYIMNFSSPVLRYKDVKSGINLGHPDFGKYINSLNLKETSGVISLRYSIGSAKYISFYGKQSNISRSLKLTTIKECQCGPLISFVGIHNDYFISIVSGNDLAKLLNIIDPSRDKTEVVHSDTRSNNTMEENVSYLVKMKFKI